MAFTEFITRRILMDFVVQLNKIEPQSMVFLHDNQKGLIGIVSMHKDGQLHEERYNPADTYEAEKAWTKLLYKTMLTGIIKTPL